MTDYKVGYEVLYKPDGRKYKITSFSTSYGKKYAHLIPLEGIGSPLRVVLPLSDVFLCMPDNINDILAEF